MPPSAVPVWVRKGLVFGPGLPGPDWSAHCQMPTPLVLDDGAIRMFYCSRDQQNRAHMFSTDLGAAPPWPVLGRSDGPVLAPGLPGAFDAAGVMPTALAQMDDELWMYYIGWSVRADVPYHNAIGVVRSRDQGRTFERFLPGPVIGAGPYEPYFCGTGDIVRIGDKWVMYYQSTTEWLELHGKFEPRYHLKQAFSEDGVHWDQGRQVAIDYLSEAEGGVTRATVLPGDDGYWMWFCHRGIDGYRSPGEQAYRLGLAWSPDGLDWRRLPDRDVFTALPTVGDFDADMECYPAVLRAGADLWLFYNGSGFGQTGVGYATLAGTARGGS